MSGKVGEEAQNFPEAAILDIVEVEKAIPRLNFFPLQGCPNSPGTGGNVSISWHWVLSFEERLWSPSCILEEPNPNFGTQFGIEMLVWDFVVLLMTAGTLSGCCPSLQDTGCPSTCHICQQRFHIWWCPRCSGVSCTFLTSLFSVWTSFHRTGMQTP